MNVLKCGRDYVWLDSDVEIYYKTVYNNPSACIYIVPHSTVCMCTRSMNMYTWNWKYPNKWSNVNSCKRMSKPSCLVNQSVPRTVEFFYLLRDAHNQQRVLTPEASGHFWWVPRPLLQTENPDNDDSIKGISSSRGPCSDSMLVFRDVHQTWMIPGINKWFFMCRFFHSHLSLQ